MSSKYKNDANDCNNKKRKPEELQGFFDVAELYLTDMPGKLQYFSLPTNLLKNKFESGFDGSSIRGYQEIHESDMLLVPDFSTAVRNPFTAHSTVMLLGNVKDPKTKQWYARDPRYVAQKAEKFLRETGIADTAYFGPEAEFFIFDKARFDAEKGLFEVDSDEAKWNTGKEVLPSGRVNDGWQIRHKEGYFPASPEDKTYDLRAEMALLMGKMGIVLDKWHHEVSSAGQAEIDMKYDSLANMADKLQIYKFVVKNTAHKYGKTATFMPKVLLNDNGSGMHVHFSLWHGNEPLFAGGEYSGLSKTALHAIGGILKHAPAILAFAAPTTNSYRRLVPGYEAPVKLAYSARNRSAAIRIPTYEPENPKATRIEFRCPDPSSNPYLVFSAMLMAAVDGIENKIDPGEPMEKDIYHKLTDDEKKKISSTPTSLEESLKALNEDNRFLLKGEVFTEDLIDAHIGLKEKELSEYREFEKGLEPGLNESKEKLKGRPEKTIKEEMEKVKTKYLLAKEAEMYYNT